jgi:uncharacterized membrane protein YjjP (DUF1212 family)
VSAEQPSVYRTMDFALRIGELVLAAGAGAADTIATMLAVTSAGGLRNCEADVTFTTLTLSHQATPDSPPAVRQRGVRYRGLDYTRLTAVDQLVRQFTRGEIELDAARKELAAVVSRGHRYPYWASLLGWGGIAGGAGALIGGDWFVSLVAFGSAVLIASANRLLSTRRVPGFYQNVLGGFLATAIGVAAARLFPDLVTSLVIAAGIVVMLAGVTLVGALQDALTGFYVTASARSFEALLLTGGIIAGVSGGLGLANLLGGPLPVHALRPLGLEHVALGMVGAAITSGAFAFACYAPPRALAPVALLGALTQLIYRPAIELGMGSAWSSAMAAVAVGLVSFSVSGRVRIPPLICLVCGIVPLLPGLAIYRGLFQLSQNNLAGLTSLMAAAAIAAGLASGALLGEYIAQPLRREARRLETKLSGPRLVGPIRPRRKRVKRLRGTTDRG